MKDETDKRYEVVVKHCYNGILHVGSFRTFEQARGYLLDCWPKLHIDYQPIQINCGGAIYDKQEARKRVFLIGAPNLTKENAVKRD
jgi:hypothetical protein